MSQRSLKVHAFVHKHSNELHNEEGEPLIYTKSNRCNDASTHSIQSLKLGRPSMNGSLLDDQSSVLSSYVFYHKNKIK